MIDEIVYNDVVDKRTINEIVYADICVNCGKANVITRTEHMEKWRCLKCWHTGWAAQWRTIHAEQIDED
jgi:ribosomal protein S27AE